MPSFFKNKDRKKKGKDATIEANDLLNGVGDENKEDEMIDTELLIHPNWQLTTEQQYVLRFQNNQLPPLKPNQLSLSGIDIERQQDGGLHVLAFLRNSLTKSINLQKATLLLLNADGEKIARKEFDLSAIGNLEPKTSMPWNFQFSSDDLVIEDIPEDGWKLAFELQRNHQLDLEESWEKSLADEDKEKLKQLVNSVNPPKPGEVNFMGIKAEQVEQGDLHVTLLIRNGGDKNINIEKLPLQIQDASGQVVAKGAFTLKNLEVKANTSKPWTFIYPSSLIEGDSIDLSSWKAQPIQ